jgi:hypothetical protein
MPIIGSFGAGSAGGFGQRKGKGAFPVSLDYLVVAGGGGAGNDNAGGGGGGGYRASGYGPAPLQGSTLCITSACHVYNITVGGGGSSGPSIGTNGNDSVFNVCGVEGTDKITSTGGGAGGGQEVGGNPGGSGGGAGSRCQTGGSGNTPPFSPSQGNPGGNSTANSGGAGGGGATASGGPAPGSSAGPGGNGAPNLINCGGTPFSITAFSGGGGGGGNQQNLPGAPGGSGGGGAGDQCGAATPGTVNTGGGGGGAGQNYGSAVGGSGGSGAVVIRTPSAFTLAVTPCTNQTATHPGGDKIATFTVSGTLTIT